MASVQSGFQLKLTGPGLSLDKEISEELAKRITLLVLSDGKAEPEMPSGKGGGGDSAVSRSTIPAQNTSIREYLLASGAKKIHQQMTVIGHYLLETQKKDSFSKAELLKGFNNAKESLPKNPHRDINDAIRRGWIAQSEKDSYYITITGSKAIEDRFPKVARKRKRKKSTKPVPAKTR